MTAVRPTPGADLIGALHKTRETAQQARELARRDREVRAHERAHKAAAGGHAGAISYDFRRGPDGQRYAVSGEVPMDLSPEASPQETLRKMQQVRDAALAPASPSAADRRIASTAAARAAEARVELAREQRQELLPRGERGPGREAGPAGQYAEVADMGPAELVRRGGRVDITA